MVIFRQILDKNTVSQERKILLNSLKWQIN